MRPTIEQAGSPERGKHRARAEGGPGQCQRVLRQTPMGLHQHHGADEDHGPRRGDSGTDG
eukprot:21870-Eustigmatos_ZCMA.PRE.2